MKLLRVKASNFKNCQDDTVIDLVAKSKKTTEDKEYELQEIAEGLYVYSIGAFIGIKGSLGSEVKPLWFVIVKAMS